jgi:hypothetical protein
MISQNRVVAGAASAALALSLVAPAVAGARNTNTLLGGNQQSQAAVHLTAASDAAIAEDVSKFTLNGGSSKGLGPLLEALSQVNGIKGTQFGDDLSTLATDMSNESYTSSQNFIDGANKLQTESASFPAPFNTFFYNLGSGLLELYSN